MADLASPLTVNLSPKRLRELARNIAAELDVPMGDAAAKAIAAHVLHAFWVQAADSVDEDAQRLSRISHAVDAAVGGR